MLNRKARKFLLQHCVSKRNAEIIAYDFSGFLNSNDVNNLELIREHGKWRVFGSMDKILSLKGDIDCFFLTRNTI